MKPKITAALKTIFIFSLAILTLNSCEKEDTTDYTKNQYNGPIPPWQKPKEKEVDTTGTIDTVLFESIEEYFNTNIPQVESFNLQANNGGIIRTKKGSVISIPPNAFITQNGLPVTGNVDIRVKEIFSNSDMIFSGVFPVSNGDIINSGGEIFIGVTQNGNNLRVANGQSLAVDMPAQAVDPQMQLFFAGPNENANPVNWTVIDSSSFSNFTFSSAGKTYNINLDSLGWCNIDQFLKTLTYCPVTFNLLGVSGLDNSNTLAYAIYKNQNVVYPVGTMQYFPGNITNSVIYESRLAAAPLNLLVFAVKNGKLYYGLLDLTPQCSNTYNIEMKEITEKALNDLINSLP